MIYARWKLIWDGEPPQGYGPQEIAKSRGDSVDTAFFGEPHAPKNYLYGYLNDGFDFSGLDAYEMSEITQIDMLEKAQELNPKCYIDDNGRITAPPFEGN